MIKTLFLTNSLSKRDDKDINAAGEERTNVNITSRLVLLT